MHTEKKLVLLELLADGECHSGEELGQILGVSRAAIWKNLHAFSAWGVEVKRVRGVGYRIDGGLDLLNEMRIRSMCDASVFDHFDSLILHRVVDSTNTALLDAIRENSPNRTQQICLAEMQSAGRGRRGRVWQSPFARNIYLSLSWQFDRGAGAMQGLSLAAGLAVVSALEALGCSKLRLKWPNDILVDGAKLGGILVEIAGDANGICHAVIGVGLNVAMPGALAKNIDQAWTDLAAITEDLPPRNAIVAALIDHLHAVLIDYQEKGFKPYREAWEQKNAHDSREVFLVSPSKTLRGIMRGVNDVGALCLEVDGQLQEHVGGELSLRPEF